MKIALDAMGGDFAPDQVVAGGVQAHRELGVEVIFVGVKDKVDSALAASGAGKWAQIEDAPEVIAMDEHLVQASEPLLRALEGINFIGNIEGKDIFKGKADVVVTDGFSGNILIKTAEGAAEFVFQSMRDAVKGDPLATLGGALLRPKLRAVRRRADWREFGGALLLGVNGVAVIAHGRSDARATYNAVRVARDAVDRQVVATIAAAVPSPAGQRKSEHKSAPLVT